MRRPCAPGGIGSGKAHASAAPRQAPRRAFTRRGGKGSGGGLCVWRAHTRRDGGARRTGSWPDVTAPAGQSAPGYSITCPPVQPLCQHGAGPAVSPSGSVCALIGASLRAGAEGVLESTLDPAAGGGQRRASSERASTHEERGRNYCHHIALAVFRAPALPLLPPPSSSRAGRVCAVCCGPCAVVTKH